MDYNELLAGVYPPIHPHLHHSLGGVRTSRCRGSEPWAARLRKCWQWLLRYVSSAARNCHTEQVGIPRAMPAGLPATAQLMPEDAESGRIGSVLCCRIFFMTQSFGSSSYVLNISSGGETKDCGGESGSLTSWGFEASSDLRKKP